jgi:hypothetical protein
MKVHISMATGEKMFYTHIDVDIVVVEPLSFVELEVGTAVLLVAVVACIVMVIRFSCKQFIIFVRFYYHSF